MSHRDDSITLQEMIDHTIEAIDLAAGMQRGDLDSQRVTYLALLQLCQIVGEAATRLDAATRDAHPEIPWGQIIAFRNRLIHGYDTIDRNILWQILTTDFPDLRENLKLILSDESGS